MHGPDRLGKPRILPLCLKEGSTERSYKNQPFIISLSYRMRHLQSPEPQKKTEQRVDECHYQKLTILRTSGHSQCKPQDLVASEKDYTPGVFSLNHVNRALIFNILFSIV